MKRDQTIIRKNLMEQLHFITNLLDIKDPNIKIRSLIWIPSRLTFLTLKRLACLLEFSLKSALSSAIIAQKLVKKLLWPVLLTSFSFQLQPSFENLMTLAVYLKLCPRTSTPLKWVLSYKALRISISSPFLKSEHSCHPKSLSSLRSNCLLSGENHYYGSV